MTNFTPTHDEIAAHAYQIYLREGCAEGRDVDHWLQAETELRQRAAQSNGNGESESALGCASQPEAQEGSPRSQRQNKPESILTNSVSSPTAPLAQVSRANTPKRNSGKRETAPAR